LRTLDLRGNGLVEVPRTVLRHARLTRLDLEANRFVGVPGFPRDSPLEALVLSDNPLRRLAVDRLPRGLVELEVNDAGLAAIPADLIRLRRLRRLAIANPKSALPDLRALDELEWIELAGQLGDAVFDLLPASLTELRGYGSHTVGLSRIPRSIARFERLRVLVLPHESLVDLPPELRALPLESLDLSATELGDTPTFAHLPATLRSLALTAVGMTRWPARIGELVELRRLALRSNQLTALPPQIGELTALQELALDGNRLTSLPAEMARLTALERLTVTGNPLDRIPPEIRALPRLTRLEAPAELLR
jgi:Leucine-rich repeat (LRR) protein